MHARIVKNSLRSQLKSAKEERIKRQVKKNQSFLVMVMALFDEQASKQANQPDQTKETNKSRMKLNRVFL